MGMCCNVYCSMCAYFGQVGLKDRPALAGSIAGIVFMCVYIFYRKDNIMGSSLIALGQRSVIFILLAGLATGLFWHLLFLNPYMRATHFRLQL